MRVGVIGLGKMGSGMAASLLRAGHDVTVYNRSSEKAQPLVAAGAREATDPAAMGDVEAVITMLTDDAAECDLAFGFGLVDRLPVSTVHIASSTISVETAERLAEAHALRGRCFLGAPVSGRGDMAAAGELFVLVSGPDEIVRRVKPVLDAIGQRTFAFGEGPGTAHAAKLCVNFMLAGAIETMGEAFGLAERLGVDAGAFHAFFSAGMFAAPAFRVYGDLIARQDFASANTPVPIGLKDLRLVRRAADRTGTPMPLAALVEEKLLAAIDEGLATHDWSVIARRRLADDRP